MKSSKFFLLLLAFTIYSCNNSERAEEASQDIGSNQELETVVKKAKTIADIVYPENEATIKKFMGGNTLLAGESLISGGEWLDLDDEEISFGARVLDNGNFILFNSGDRLWTSSTTGHGDGCELKMQLDGNLVLYDKDKKAIWSSMTYGSKYNTPDSKPVKLVLEPNLLVLYSASNKKVWSNEDQLEGSLANHTETFTLDEWPKHVLRNDGCSCSFSLDRDNYKTMVFASDIETKACFKLHGSMELLTDNKINSKKLIQQSKMVHWIVLNEKGDDLLFGQKINYQEEWHGKSKAILVKTLSVMDKLPKEIPIKSIGTVGMGHRSEFRDMCNEALAEAAKVTKSASGSIYSVHYGNEKYDCFIEADEIGKNDGGGIKYEGNMIIKSKDDKVISSQKVWGSCGC